MGKVSLYAWERIRRFFSTKCAWVFLGEIATLEPCSESRREIATLALAMTREIATLALAMTREIATAAPRNDEKGKGGHLRICPYIIRKKKEDAWV